VRIALTWSGTGDWEGDMLGLAAEVWSRNRVAYLV
jgi:hypothetical protein